MWQDLAVAFSLMLVIEGIIPFLNPGRWRNMVAFLAEVDNRKLRIMGLGSMLAGTLLLYLLK